MTGNIYFKIKLLKNPFSKPFSYDNQGIRKKKTSKDFSIRISTSPFTLSSFHRQTLFKVNIISVLIFRIKSILIGQQSVLMGTQLLSCINLSIFSSLSTLQFIERVNHQLFYVPCEENKMSLIPNLYSISSSQKLHQTSLLD